MTAASVSRLHAWRHADYDEARRDIHTYIGDISKEELFGRQVLVAVYVRPNVTGTGTFVPRTYQEQDISQGKAVLILACGPSAFTGDKSYLDATYGPGVKAPSPGDWVVVRPADGMAISMFGENAARVKAKDRKGDDIDKFDWDGWPCRIIADDSVIMRMSVPHAVV